MRGLDIFLRSAAALGQLHPTSRHLNSTTEVVISERSYLPGGNPAHHLDVYRPRGSNGTLPIILYIHGGGFRILSKDTHKTVAQRFAQAGYAVVNINYRLTPAGAFPAALQDVCAALLWSLDNADEFGGDPKQIVYAGDSAGANLTLALAICGSWRRREGFAQNIFRRHPDPFAILPACGINEVHNVARFLDDRAISRWIRGRIKVVCEGYLGADEATAELASPLRFLESAAPPDHPFPPTFALCGGADPIRADSQRLGDALRRLHIPSEVKFYPGGGHAFHAFYSAKSSAAWRDQLQFLSAQRALIAGEAA
jgi:acetyl esterase